MNGAPKTVYGTIAIGSADNPASNALGGFKEGFTAFATVGSVWVLWRSVKMRLVGHQVTRNFTILVLADVISQGVE